jgi:hypothetical protein
MNRSLKIQNISAAKDGGALVSKHSSIIAQVAKAAGVSSSELSAVVKRVFESPSRTRVDIRGSEVIHATKFPGGVELRGEYTSGVGYHAITYK